MVAGWGRADSHSVPQESVSSSETMSCCDTYWFGQVGGVVGYSDKGLFISVLHKEWWRLGHDWVVGRGLPASRGEEQGQSGLEGQFRLTWGWALAKLPLCSGRRRRCGQRAGSSVGRAVD